MNGFPSAERSHGEVRTMNRYFGAALDGNESDVAYYEIRRDGESPLRFDGKLMARMISSDEDDDDFDGWKTWIAVYQTVDSKLVVAFASEPPDDFGIEKMHRAEVFESLSDASVWVGEMFKDQRAELLRALNEFAARKETQTRNVVERLGSMIRQNRRGPEGVSG
jgi:hypothetical protein